MKVSKRVQGKFKGERLCHQVEGVGLGNAFRKMQVWNCLRWNVGKRVKEETNSREMSVARSRVL